MIRTLIELLRTGNVTQRDLFPELPAYSRGLPMLTESACAAGCSACVDACPTHAITVDGGRVTLDRGRCIACGGCTDACPTGTIAPDRRTSVAVRRRSELILTNNGETKFMADRNLKPSLFGRSLHVRSVSTGDNASDMELQATDNAIFDSSRFGIHIVASPRAADCLLVTGPVPRPMREPLRRCYEAMAEPKIVVAAGAPAISGGIHRGGYAEAEGVEAILPVDAYIPGNPPHPWYILHGLLLIMGKEPA